MTPRRAEELIRVIEINLAKLSDPDHDIPLHLLDRLERAVHNCHVVNNLRVSRIGHWTLLAPDHDSHDYGPS